jgi:hypothetical protein
MAMQSEEAEQQSLPIPPVTTPVRSHALLRAFTALGETRLQLVLAAIIAFGSGFWAWSLAATAFAAPPAQATPPGIIFVAIGSHGPRASAPIDVRAVYYSLPDQTAINYGLNFSQTVVGSARKLPSPNIMMILCGPIARHPQFLNLASSRPVQWKAINVPDASPVISFFEPPSPCTYATIAMHESGRSPSSFRQVIIIGPSDSALSETSGTKVSYDLPGIADWFPTVTVDGMHPAAMPAGSMLTVSLQKDPVGFTNMFVSPQLLDSGSLTWTNKLDAKTLIPEYRLEADSLSAVSQLQAHLFIAGALVGVSGGAFLWLVQLGGQAGYRAIAKRTRRPKSPTPRPERSGPVEPVASKAAVARPAEPEGSGLGWPSTSL